LRYFFYFSFYFYKCPFHLPWTADLIQQYHCGRNQGDSDRDSFVFPFLKLYNATGYLLAKTDHTGKKTTYTYDGLGRLTGESETGGNPVITSYSNDRCNRLIQKNLWRR